ncbi:MAG: trehalose-6-phosphate synthase [Candidatus Zixiibacteriota bacterium]
MDNAEFKRRLQLQDASSWKNPTSSDPTQNPEAEFANSGRTPMQAGKLAEMIREVAAGSKLIVVSNREPVIHERIGNAVRATRPASGMVTGLEPIVRAVRGTWVAHGSGSADRRVVDESSRLAIPREDPHFTLRRVWLSREEELGYYHGVANSALWPLCHIVYARPQFSRSQWEIYKRVNERFCEAVLEEVGNDNAIIFIQDYHLALLPRMLRERRSDLTLIQFWHIPWPNPEAFRVFPWDDEILDGLLGNDLLGFHIQYHCNNFIDTVDQRLESRIDREKFCVVRGGRPTYVRPFPISVDFDQIQIDVTNERIKARANELLAETSIPGTNQIVLVGVDRLDYTKGILERLHAFDLLLTENPDFKEHVTMLQFAAPSRTVVDAYRRLNEETEALVADINYRHETNQWTPIYLLRSQHDYISVLAAYRLARVLMVTSLHDGMNLVAKEFVASRSDGDGILLLSQYTGAARELVDAIQVNPFDTDELAGALKQAIMMEEPERRARMSRMRDVVRNNNVYDWGKKIFSEVRRIMPTLAIRRGEA